MTAEEGPSVMPRAPSRTRIGYILCCLMMACGMLLLPALSQDGSTVLEGTVEDLSGARIAGASVQLLNPDNGFHSTATSDAEGRFHFAMLAPGRYNITVSAPGMADASQTGLQLHVGGSMQLQFRLRPAGRAENITVTAPPPINDPESGEVSQLIDPDPGQSH